jgi:hypothetical protein
MADYKKHCFVLFLFFQVLQLYCLNGANALFWIKQVYWHLFILQIHNLHFLHAEKALIEKNI